MTETDAQPVVRLSLNVAPDVADTLRAIADKRGDSVAETVRRAIAALKFLADATEDGLTIAVIEDGKARAVTLL